MTTDSSFPQTAGILQRLERFWLRLIEPKVPVPDIERRHQLRLISGLSLAAAGLGFIMGVLITPFLIAPDNPFGTPVFFPGLISSIVPLLIYFQSRAGRYYLSAVLLIAVGVVGPWVSSLNIPTLASVMLVGVLFSFLFLPGLGVVVTAGVSLALMLLLPVIRPEIGMELVLPIIEAQFIVSALFFVARRHLDGIAQERQAVVEQRNEALTHQAGEIDRVFRAAAVGDFDARAAVFGADELGNAAVGVNALLSQFTGLLDEIDKAAQERFADIGALGWAWEVDAEGHYTAVSELFANTMGYTSEELIGKTPFDLMPPEEAERVAPLFGEIIAGKQPIIDLENWNLTKEGQRVLLVTSGRPILDEDGNLIGYRGVDKDMTARREAEEQLAARNEALGNALEELRMLITNVDFAAQQLTGASESIVDVVTLLTGQASTSAKLAEEAAVSAQEGNRAVSDTILAMGRIRESSQETTRRIKRLGEASQEIGEVVRLIDEISDRVTILALNASIQAAAAGEAGRGFAVVAEEVQRLAERSTNATRQIENMVKSIQGEINEAMIGVEEATREVVDGSQLAQSAGERITDLNQAIGDLANLVQHVADTTSTQTTEALASLAALAADLQASVSALEIPTEPSPMSDNGGKVVVSD